MFKLRVSVVLLCLLSVPSAVAQTEDEEALPSLGDAWEMAPVIRQASVSPDGQELMVMRAVSKTGPYVVEVYQTDRLDDEPVRFGGGKTEILSALWLRDGYLYIEFGKEVGMGQHSFGMDSRAAITRSDGEGDWLELESEWGVGLFHLLPDDPEHILITTDNNDNGIPDIVRFNVKTKAKTLVQRGTERYADYIPDRDGELRVKIGSDAKQENIYFWFRKKGESKWRKLWDISILDRAAGGGWGSGL